MIPLTERSPCKVNFVLNPLGLRPDGYHELETLFYPVPLFDELTIEAGDPGLVLTCSRPELPIDGSNLVHKAATQFFQSTGLPPAIRIHLEKKLPLAAGLGGGSANAAVTLRLLNQFFGGPLPASTLDAIAARLGSDVNFFLQDGPAIGLGRGERIQPLPAFRLLEGKAMVLFHPGFGVSTPWAFKQLSDFPEARNGRPGRASEVANAFLAGDWPSAAAGLYNGLEQPVLQKFPILRIYQEFFLTSGARAALMSGSGSTTFALFDSPEQARSVLPVFKDRFGPSGWLEVAPL